MQTLTDLLNDGTIPRIPFPSMHAQDEAFRAYGPAPMWLDYTAIHPITEGASAIFRTGLEQWFAFVKIEIYDPNNYMIRGYINSNPINMQMACAMFELKQAGVGDTVLTEGNSSSQIMNYVNDYRRSRGLPEQNPIRITNDLINGINGNVWVNGQEVLIPSTTNNPQ